MSRSPRLTSRRGRLTLLLVLGGILTAGPARAASGSADGGDSYWGPLPARADSVSRVGEGRGMPLWEKTLYYPYRLATLPLVGVGCGLTGTAVFLSENRVVRTVAKFYSGFDGPFGTRINPNFTAGGLLGTGGGLSLAYPRHRPTGLSPGAGGDSFKLRWQSTTNESHKLTVGVLATLGGRDALEFGLGYRVRPNARYFGLGPATRERDKSYFLQELSWAGTQWNHTLTRNLVLQTSGLLSAIGHRGPTVDVSPSLAEAYAGDPPPGYGPRSDGVSFGLALVHDDTPETGRPERGSYRRLKATYFASIDDSDQRYWSWRAELQQFVPLWLGRRHLALRGVLTRIEPQDGKPLHFQRLLTNDDPDLLRGYQDYRWRDRGLAALTVEYRWPVWNLSAPRGAGFDAYLFTDLGQVYGDFAELALDRLTESYGFGLRVIDFHGVFSARLEIAWSDEDTVLRLRGDQLFQFAKGDLHYGRDPVPTR